MEDQNIYITIFHSGNGNHLMLDKKLNRLRGPRGSFLSPVKHCGSKTPPVKDCYCTRCVLTREYRRQWALDKRRQNGVQSKKQKELWKLFFDKAKYFCDRWEQDYRNCRDPEKTSKELMNSRSEMFIAYRNAKKGDIE